MEIANRCPHTRVGAVEVWQLVPMGGPLSVSRPRAKGARKTKSPARRKKR